MVELQLLAGLNALERAPERVAAMRPRQRLGSPLALAATGIALLWIARARTRAAL